MPDLSERWILVWMYLSACVLLSRSSCLQPLFLNQSTQYSGKMVTQGIKTSAIVSNRLQCISFCVYVGDKTSILYDPTTDRCTCHNLPLSLLSVSPKPGVIAYGSDTLPTDTVELWIASVIDESSHYTYNSRDYSSSYPATKMIGPPDFYPEYGNTQSAWCPAHLAKAYVELAISESVYITEIHIYEILWAGGVEILSIRDLNSNWVEVWRTPEFELIEKSRIFSPNFIPPDFKSNALRIDIDLGVTNVWSEFDAVRVIGTRQRTRTSLP